MKIFDFDSDEWKKFSKTEKKILTFVHKYNVSHKDRLRMLLGFPLEPMKKDTFRSHYAKLQKKIARICKERVESEHESVHIAQGDEKMGGKV